MRLNAILAVTAALALGVIAAGCGSSDDNSTSTTATAAAISKADFLAKGNQICKQGNDEINAAGKKLGQSVSQQQFEDFASNTVVPSIQKQIDGIKALGAPAGEEAQVNQLVSTAQADLDQLKADPSKLQDDSLFKDANQKANAVGLTECAG
jgi:hypothetical protein